MAIGDTRVVAVTPAGRKQYLQLLIPQVLQLRPLVDEYRLWVNTDNAEDIKYMYEVSAEYPEYIKIERLPEGVKVNGNNTIRHFFKNCVDSSTVYVRFDDDIVYLDDTQAFIDFLRFRLENPQYFLVFANILNNSVVTHVLQRMERLPPLNGKITAYDSMAEGWHDPVFAEHLHMCVLQELYQNGSLERFRTAERWLFAGFERVSINCISWLGSEFAKFDGIVGDDEEPWLASEKPSAIGVPNCMYGGFCCVHFSFHVQSEHLSTTRLLEHYARCVSAKCTQS